MDVDSEGTGWCLMCYELLHRFALIHI